MPNLATIGVDIGGTSAKGAVVSPDGEILARAERPTDISAGTKSLIAVVEELVQAAVEVEVVASAIGVGAAGFIDSSTGSVTFSPNLVYDDPHISDALSSRFGLPAVVENDANAAAWGEFVHGGASGVSHLAFVGLGTGIGSGFVIDGQLLRGSSGAGAELGHTVIDPDGPTCGCGLRGCLEQFASGTGIARLASEAVERSDDSAILQFSEGAEITALHVAQAAREYDETARAVLRRAGTALGIGLSNVVNIFDPEVIVLGGSVINAGEPFLGPARDTLARMTHAQRRRAVRLDVSGLGQDVGILGAAALAAG